MYVHGYAPHAPPSHTAALHEQTRCWGTSVGGHFFLSETDGRRSKPELRYYSIKALAAPSDPERTWSHAEIPLGTFSSWRWSPIFGACFIVLPTSGSRRRRPRSAGSSQTNPSRAPPAPGVPAESPLAQMSPLRVTILPPRVTSGKTEAAGRIPPRCVALSIRAEPANSERGHGEPRARGMPAGSAAWSPARAGPAPGPPPPQALPGRARDSAPRRRSVTHLRAGRLAGSAPPAPPPPPPPGSLTPSPAAPPPPPPLPPPGHGAPLPRPPPSPPSGAASPHPHPLAHPPGSPHSAPRGLRRPGSGTGAAHAPPTRDLTAETAAAETETTAETAARGHEPAGGAHPPAALSRRRRRSSAHCLGQRRERPPFPRRLTALRRAPRRAAPQGAPHATQ